MIGLNSIGLLSKNSRFSSWEEQKGGEPNCLDLIEEYANTYLINDSRSNRFPDSLCYLSLIPDRAKWNQAIADWFLRENNFDLLANVGTSQINLKSKSGLTLAELLTPEDENDII